MKESKVLYGFWDGKDFSGIVWETELGTVITMQGSLDPQQNLRIKSVDGKDCEDVDLRNVLMSVLPLK
jgi:hypothetical protein